MHYCLYKITLNTYANIANALVLVLKFQKAFWMIHN